MDGTATAEVFEHAARYEPELTDRQREVLRLIARGRTNIEIAEAMDMTLAGAKWHVSELLTKLGLESREAAAEYYRWREAPRRRLARGMRGVFSATALKWGLAAAGGIAAVGVGAVVLFAMNGDEIDPGPAVPGLPFYMEATFTRSEEHSAYDVARRYWYQDASRTRTESDSPLVTRNDPGFEMDFGAPGTSVTVRDGLKEWRQNGPTYSGTPIDTLPPGSRPLGGSDVGPIPHGSVAEYIDSLRDPASEVSIRGGRLLGRNVTVVEVELRNAELKVVRREEHWIDEERLLVLMSVFEANAEGSAIVAVQRVTKIEYGRNQPADRFVWSPAPGTFEKTCPRVGDVVSATGATPPPFLSVPVAALHGKLELRSFGATGFDDSRCDLAEVHYRFESGPMNSQSFLAVREDFREPSSVFSSPSSDPVDIGGIEARLGDANDGGRSVAWVAGGVGVEVRSTVLTDEELVAFAKAMVAANP